MSQVKNGDTVKVHYTGKLEGGEVFDSSRERQPIEFLIGNGDVLTGIENGVVGMEVGDMKTIEVPPEEAFGVRHEELVVEVMKSHLPDNVTPVVGQRLRIYEQEDQAIVVTITKLSEETVTLDANHPLAGNTLVFDIELVEII